MYIALYCIGRYVYLVSRDPVFELDYIYSINIFDPTITFAIVLSFKE